MKSMHNRVVIGIAVLATALSAFAARGWAQERSEHWEGTWRGHEVERWRQGDIRRFHEEDLGRWRAGHWVHGEHFGRPGWWWVVDGTWFIYPAPVYPYPDPYVPPPAVTQAPVQPPQYWYFCPSANAYYPYVTACPEGWTPVVAQPQSSTQ
jgi:hypothetical protein